MTKVCHITSVHPPGDARIFVKECCSLAAAGFDVTLVYCGEHDNSYLENGVNKICVKRHGKGRFSRFIKDTRKVVEKALTTGATVFHFHDPELIPHAIKLHKKGYTVFYDAHEDLPLQILSKHYIPVVFRNPIAYFADLLENSMVKNSSGIIAATPSITEKFKRKGANTVTIHNFPKTEELVIDDSEKEADHFSVCYVGGIMKTRGIIQMVKAMKGLPCKLELVGSFSPASLREEIVRMPEWNQVIEHGFLDRNGVREIYKKCHVGLVTLLPSPNYLEAYPVKMFEYMAAGLAVIASDFPLYRSIVEDGECGLCVDPTDPEAIRNAILQLMNNPEKTMSLGRNGQALVKSKFNWAHEAEILVKFYHDNIRN